MKRALIVFAVLLPAPLFAAPVASTEVPVIDVTALCKARSVEARFAHYIPDQSVAECEQTEHTAKDQLTSLWNSSAAPLRRQCESDARALGTTSYVDLLSCLQIAGDLKADPPKLAGKP